MNSFLTFAASLLVLLSSCAVLDAQLGYGVVPVGTISRLSANGEREVISSVGGAKVGIYRKVYPPQPLYVVPRYPPLVPRHPPVPVVKKPYPTKKPGVTGRIVGGVLGGLLGGIGGALGGILGGR